MTDNNTIAKEIGYMSYNKLNVFMTILLVGFSAVFALLGDRVTKLNIDMSWPNESTWKRFLNNIWVWVVNIVLLIVALVLLVKKYVTNAINIALFVFMFRQFVNISPGLQTYILFCKPICNKNYCHYGLVSCLRVSYVCYVSSILNVIKSVS